MEPSKRFLKLLNVVELNSLAVSPPAPCSGQLALQFTAHFNRGERLLLAETSHHPRCLPSREIEERRHLNLPALVYRVMLHGRAAFVEVVGHRNGADDEVLSGRRKRSKFRHPANGVGARRAISGQTCAWRALYSSTFPGRTLSRKHVRIEILITCRKDPNDLAKILTPVASGGVKGKIGNNPGEDPIHQPEKARERSDRQRVRT